MALSIQSADSSEGYVRLHITPFNPSLLHTIIPSSVLPNARNISYHSLQTFSEKGYGFVDLPMMEAEKIKKKLNGSILKGTKLRIEKAKPKKTVPLDEQAEEAEQPQKQKEKKDSSKKRKREADTIPGAEIGERQVKRGWTTPAAAIKTDKHTKEKKKAVVKSKYTTNPECLFKTVLPPNVAAKSSEAPSKIKPERKKTSKAGNEVVVHEFAKSTKYATFLRGPATSYSSAKPATEFVDGRGWVDEDGNVVEEVKQKGRNSVKNKDVIPVVQEDPEVIINNDPAIHSEGESSSSENESSSSEDGSSSSEDESSSEEVEDAIEEIAAQIAADGSETSSSGTSSEEEDSAEESSSDDDSSTGVASKDPISRPDSSPNDSSVAAASKKLISTPHSSSGPPLGLSIRIPLTIPEAVATSAVEVAAVHPLEALFKKPRLGTNVELPAPQSFSFFGSDAAETDETPETETNTHSQDQVPLTPFTQKEFEYRGLRSAAPTPDTAHHTKRFIWPIDNGQDEDEDEDEPEADSNTTPSRQSALNPGDQEAEGGQQPESDFQKWFYENRGEANRAWKKRRKVVSKEKRQRENRKRADRGV